MLANDSKLELRLPLESRAGLDQLAAECGLSRADLCRLSINWLLRHPDILLRLPPPDHDRGVAA